jgi:acetyltransferase-like isoleucine patch superfamily enzyme
MQAVPNIRFDHDFVTHLAHLGISVSKEGVFPVHPDTVIEPPVTLFDADIWLSQARIGAFSYLGTNSIFSSARAGRYCSFGRGLEVGLPQHPDDWITSSPLAYFPNFLNFERHLVDVDPEWRRSLTVAPYPPVPETVIGNDLWIGASVYIREGVTIGDGAIIGAHSVVTRDVPPYAVMLGTPARVHRFRFEGTVIERLLAVRWWDYAILDFDGWDVRDVPGAISALEDAIAGGRVERYAPAPINLVEEHARYRKIRKFLKRKAA